MSIHQDDVNTEKKSEWIQIRISPRNKKKLKEMAEKEAYNSLSQYILDTLLEEKRGNVNTNKGDVNTLTKAFRTLYKILKEMASSPYVSYSESEKYLFDPNLQQFWVDLLTRHGLAQEDNIVDKCREALEEK